MVVAGGFVLFIVSACEAAKLSFSVWAGYALSQKAKLKGYGKDLLVPVILPFGLILTGLIVAGKDIGTC